MLGYAPNRKQTFFNFLNFKKMKITIQKLEIINFKGIQSLTIDFNDGQTNVFGSNGSGKTTITDAYRWLLTGKDSHDRKDFEIKPTNNQGKTLPKLENQVTGWFLADGNQYTFSRTNREKWVTKRGSKDEEFQGNETKFYYNDVPLNQKEYVLKVSELFDENQIKLLTDPTYFNLGLKWNERRSILTEMAGGITDEMVLESFAKTNSPKEVAFIQALIDSEKEFDLRKRELANKRKLTKDEKELIPSRIDEVGRSINTEIDFSALKIDAEKLQNQIAQFDNQIANVNKAHEAANSAIEQKRNDLFQKQKRLAEIKQRHEIAIENEAAVSKNATNEVSTKISNLERTRTSKADEISNLEIRIKNGNEAVELSERVIASKQEEKQRLLETWKAENAKQLVFDDADCNCPTCKQSLPAKDIEERKATVLREFNNSKSAKLKAIAVDGDFLKESIQKETTSIENYKTAIAQFENQLAALNQEVLDINSQIENCKTQLNEIQNMPAAAITPLANRLIDDKEHMALLNETTALKTEIDNFQPADISSIIAEKTEVSNKLNVLNVELAKEAQIQYAETRRNELIEQEKKMAQEIAEYEAEEFAIAAFIKSKMQFVEDKVNQMFTLVKWRMFREQINGGEEPCCDCLVNGIEYEKNLNTANKINAGIDIINTLSKYYNIIQPIFLDNRESVTEIIKTESQIINLIVSPKDQKLRVETIRQKELQTA